MFRLIVVVRPLPGRNLTDEGNDEEQKHRDGHAVSFQPARIFFVWLAAFFLPTLVAFHAWPRVVVEREKRQIAFLPSVSFAYVLCTVCSTNFPLRRPDISDQW